MVQEQAKLMIRTLTEDKKAFKNFYKKGYFSYLSNKDYKGKVAIVNKAIISFLEDANDESKVVATIDFQNSGTFIYKLFGQNYSFSQFGQDPTKLTNTAQVYTPKINEIIRDIGTIRRHCAEAEEKALAIQKASSIVAKFSTILVQSDNKISSKDTLSLLQNTIEKLSKSRYMNEEEQTSDLER